MFNESVKLKPALLKHVAVDHVQLKSDIATWKSQVHIRQDKLILSDIC